MDITFKFIGLTFEAEAIVEDGGEHIFFRSLTHNGQDASFLALSTLDVDLEEAAFEALFEAKEKMRPEPEFFAFEA